MNNNRIQVPPPASGGLVLSHKCNAKCSHCMYACGPDWSNDWVSPEDLREILSALSGYIQPAAGGPDTMDLVSGLHFSGGEPFLNFELLAQATEIAAELKIPSTFVETNCFWCRDDDDTVGKLRELKQRGLVGIMISVNPFYLEYIPFERTRRCIRAALEVFGPTATMVYQLDFYRRFEALGVEGTMSLKDYLEADGVDAFLRGVEFFTMGRGASELPARILELTGETPFQKGPPEMFFDARCMPSPSRPWHNHFDNYGNYTVGYCCGVSYGDIRDIDRLVSEGIDPVEKPVLAMVVNEDIKGLFGLAESRGYTARSSGYYSRCDLCTDARKFLAATGDYQELQPLEFYSHC